MPIAVLERCSICPLPGSIPLVAPNIRTSIASNDVSKKLGQISAVHRGQVPAIAGHRDVHTVLPGLGPCVRGHHMLVTFAPEVAPSFRAEGLMADGVSNHAVPLAGPSLLDIGSALRANVLILHSCCLAVAIPSQQLAIVVALMTLHHDDVCRLPPHSSHIHLM